MTPGFVRRAALSPRSARSQVPSISDIRSGTTPYWLVLRGPAYWRTCVAVHYETLADEVTDSKSMSPCGTSRRFVATHRLGRYWRHSGHTRSVANVRMRRD